ncbi:MAG: hypothetical protein CMM47_07130 [Rhodospirillaceae bacterium]|nr:hypothetical protein [Rhodospirillaceae bacterium]|tara:strand:- start:110 stop:532 length:423 start_codon:yes stop_codon:yes gene_type:complete
MVRLIRAYFGALITFCVMDAVWLGAVATDFYYGELGDLLREDPNWLAAVVFYLGYIAGIVYFAIWPALHDGSTQTAARHGMLLGLLAYATYDMTNMATLEGWSLSISMVDMMWGMVITGTAATAGHWFAAQQNARTTDIQ